MTEAAASPSTSPTLSLPGAVPPPDASADRPAVDAGVPWHFGDPFAEQRAAARSVAVFDRSNRGVLAVPGADRFSWLHSLTSQDFTGLGVGRGSEALVLDAQGRIEHHLAVASADEVVWLDVEPGTAGALLSYLDSMRFWSQVEPRDATAELAVLSLVGPDTDRTLERAGWPVPAAPHGVAARAGGGLARRVDWPGEHAVDLLVPRGELLATWRALTEAGARPAGSWAFEALRVEALRPRLGVDTDERTIPHEVNLIGPAVHLNKGCYRGQETVAKVHNVGRPPRRMVLLHLDGSAEVQPETGDPVLLGEKVVGRVGTVVRHHELGTVALALLKRSAPVDVELVAGVDDRAVQAAVDPDSIPPEGVAPGREAVRQLRG
ncbi:CAF17-like 4Fe-4S cluster assembly/insertion protein YgfZ [Goodfellowiella coeruleoviolacea]|uniref:CAF17-like 4Fe-4S cluster assembly/insertion protein YgfZ n=1 Tax=Goodfellowiella coeruleoviolacea TaxID=334858 RepID=UPI0020A3F3A3|nr:folate-binding protein [Goodfellowiella coeruleoviolacea]